ncbi:dihydrofolate reductase [Paenibacillus physcomitrellae]|uniref:Dihydrofolate reductase n=1 Tax=Paenibacillus physcomitrellae TaxID=1619311 RepID=A0ABQ1FPD8_9BACL|nr:dihydrofolate reductase [Paenibacillus physcomitrellae]GGA25114.1 dihydrofolate reductase [Paenibacillus physcomitrellae]
MSITLIWAMAEGGVIGRDNALPWRLPADMAFFKAQTTGKTVLMGRKTWESMNGRPLPNRVNVVLTRDKAFKAEGAEVIHSFGEAVHLADKGELMVIGGAELFRYFLPIADKLLVTEIEESIEGDVVMPEIDWSLFQLTEERQGLTDEKNPYKYKFLTYERS